MLDRILDWWEDLSRKRRKTVIGAALGVLFAVLVAVAVVSIVNHDPKDKDKNSEVVNTQ